MCDLTLRFGTHVRSHLRCAASNAATTTRACDLWRIRLKAQDFDKILQEACRLVGQALNTDLAKVMQLQPDKKNLLVRAGVGRKPGVVGRVTVQASIDSSEGHALQTHSPVI